MKEFLEKSLRQNVIMTENKELYKKLPLVYRGRYDIFTVETNGALWTAIRSKDNVGLEQIQLDIVGISIFVRIEELEQARKEIDKAEGSKPMK